MVSRNRILRLVWRRPPDPDPCEVLANLASIERVPAARWTPGSPARCALILLAGAGTDTYCYASGGELTGVWCVWLGDLARVRSDHNGRVPLATWCSSWRELLREMGYPVAVPMRRRSAPEGEAAR